MGFCLLLIFFLQHLGTVFSLKILIFSPTIGHSHLQFVGTLADTLVDAGHYVHVFIPEWDHRLAGNGTAKAQRITRLKPSTPSAYSTMGVVTDPFGERKALRFSSAKIFRDLAIQICEDLLNNENLLNELRADKYDLGMTEYYEYCPVGIFEVVNIKSTIILSAIPMNDLLAESWGIPSPSSYVTTVVDASVNAPVLNFRERFHNFMTYFFGRFMFYGTMYEAQNALFKKKISKDFPDLRSLAQRAGVAFINALPVFDIPRPISSKIVYIGGIANKRPILSLSEEFSAIFEKTKKGVVLFSMGSIASPQTMPNTTRDSFLNAFAKFPEYQFILKMKRPDGISASDYGNIHFFDWIDQISLLNHPMTKGFITHAGLNSLTEASFSATPVICTPLFGDQEYNTAVAVKEGNGIYLDVRNTNEKQIHDALDKLLNDPRYMTAAEHLQRRLQQYPHNVTNLFIKWTEYVAQFDDFSTLNLHGANLDFIRYYSLDVIAFLLSIIFTIVILALILIVYFIKRILRIVKMKKD